MIVDHTRVGAAFRRLSVPTAVQMLGDQLLGIVDTIAIGALGTVALAGATAANAVFMALAFAIFGFMTGTSIIAAQRIGAHDTDGFARTVRCGAIVPLLLGVVYVVMSLFASVPIIHAMVGNLPSAHASALYLILRCASIIPIAISGTLIVGLGAAGNPRLGVLVLCVINIIHIPLLMMLCLGWWTHHPFGIAGAGLSSLISETIAAIYAVIYVARRPEYRIFSEWTFPWKIARDSTWLGLPEAVFLLGVLLPDVFIIGMLARFGPTIISAFRALNVVSDLTFVVPSPLQSASQTIIGQRLGARDVAGARWFLARAQRLAVAITFVTAIIVAACAWPLAFAFTLNAAVASVAALPLALHMITLPIKGWAMVSLAPIRAAGDTRFSMTVGIICSALVIPFAWIGIERLNLGLYSVPIGWIAAWAARAVLTQWKLRRGDWMWLTSRLQPV
jgi:putative MATE family efflux protein